MLLLIDAVVIAHLICVALGMGTAAQLEFKHFKGRNRPIEHADVVEIVRCHNLILVALLGFWGTGLVLIYVRTGAQLSEFTPKLWAKIFIVSCLSLNAIVVQRFVIPTLHTLKGVSLLAIPLRQKLPLVACMASSVMYWVSALALGASTFLKTQSFEFLALMLGVGFAIGLTLALLRAVLIRPALHK